jgi:hypothetical protein
VNLVSKFDAVLFSQLLCREIDAPGAVYSITQTQQADCTFEIVPSGYNCTQRSGCGMLILLILLILQQTGFIGSNSPYDGRQIPCLF